MKTTLQTIGFLLCMVLFVACGNTSPDNPANQTGWLDGSPIDAEAETHSAEEGRDGLFFAEAVEEPAGAPMPMATTAVASESVGQENSALTAGEVDDNAQWDDYLLYLRNYQGAQVIKVDVSERHLIRVSDNAGNPVLGALITVSGNGQEVARLRTHSDGLAYFFVGAVPAQSQASTYTATIEANGQTTQLEIPTNSSQREWNITLPIEDNTQQSVYLDVHFLIDTTGSMGDEIAQLKTNIQSISAQIDALPSQPNVRFGMTVYRDQGDAYLSRTFEFTPNIDEFAAALDEVQAGGGGDYPEDLNEALSRAIHAPEWRVEQTVSLIFLVADAPPHLDYGQESHYAVEIIEAAKRGIKIYPIASSGLDEQGEYIFRQLAQFTGGRFIFLTYGAGGPGTTGTETDLNVSGYTVSALDELVVKIVEEELAHQ